MNSRRQRSAVAKQDQPKGRFDDDPILHLEPSQLVAETSRPLPLAALSRRAAAGLWTLRVFAVLVGLMVVYTFIVQLR